MLPILATIWLLHVAALVTPGANVLLVSHLAATGDRRAAAFAALGVSIGAVIWSSAAILGISAAFVLFPTFRLMLQLAGASYLMSLGLRLWRSGVRTGKDSPTMRPLSALGAGLLTNLSNPKAALFFVGIFSAALPAHPTFVLLLAVEVLVFGNALAWHLLLAYLLSRPQVQAGFETRSRAVGRLSGCLVASLGLVLLASAIATAAA